MFIHQQWNRIKYCNLFTRFFAAGIDYQGRNEKNDNNELIKMTSLSCSVILPATLSLHHKTMLFYTYIYPKHTGKLAHLPHETSAKYPIQSVFVVDEIGKTKIYII